LKTDIIATIAILELGYRKLGKWSTIKSSNVLIGLRLNLFKKSYFYQQQQKATLNR
jgi:hypothetical protein